MRTLQSGTDFFASLEPRCYLSNPAVADISADMMAAYAGKVVTVTVHATGDQGIRAVSFWLDRQDSDGLHRFQVNSNDQPLLDVFSPDVGTTDRFSAHLLVDASWPDDATISADAVDNLGNYTGADIKFVTINARPKPFVNDLLAETLPNGDIRLTAKSSTDGFTVRDGTVAGVTFFIDQNGNNQWDAGTDVDLGIGTSISPGVYQKTVTPQGGWNLTWFSASSFDSRASTDNFGSNRSSVLRGDADAPTINSIQIVSDPDQFNSATISSGELMHITVDVTAVHGIRAASLFFDANHNGLWDVGIDTHLQTQFQVSTAPNIFTFAITADSQFGHGWQSFGVGLQDNSGRGNDSWSSISTGWIKIDNTPWITNGVLAPPSIIAGTNTVDLTFNANDDNGVRNIRRSFIDVNGNNALDVGEPEGLNFTTMTASRTDGIWRVTFDTHALAVGTYAINIWLDDYQGEVGPRSLITLNVT